MGGARPRRRRRWSPLGSGIGRWVLGPAALAAALLLYVALDPQLGLRPWLRLRAELAEAEAGVAALRLEIARLEDAAARLERGLEGDRFAWERAVREELHFARAGETLLRLPRPDAPNSRP